MSKKVTVIRPFSEKGGKIFYEAVAVPEDQVRDDDKLLFKDDKKTSDQSPDKTTEEVE